MPTLESNSTRRRFLQQAATPLIVPAFALGRGATAPSDRVTVGIIGSGQRALFETRQYPWFDNVIIVAVADAQESRRQGAKAELEKLYDQQQPQRNRGIRVYHDFHELLAQKDIDGVYIASPDHWHVSMLLPTLKAGKHVHCEKPLGISIEQDLAALKAVRQSDRIFQYGAELRAFPDAKKAIELVLNGRIGAVRHIYVVAPPSVSGGSPTPVIQPPDGFDYDKWLGPAPLRPFCADRCLTENPRGIFNISDYTLGNINNWAAHPLDQLQRWADAVGRKDPPIDYEGSGKFAQDGLFDCAIQWKVRCKWADGLILDFMDSNTYHEVADAPHPQTSWSMASKGEAQKLPNGAVFVGETGWVIVSYGKVATNPASLMNSEIGPNEIHIPDSALEKIPEGLPKGLQQTLTAGHHQNWIRAIRSGTPAVDNIEGAVRSDMISQLSELAIRTGKSLRWNPKKETIEGNDLARKMIKRPMRAPYGLA
jgi:hypothetical protein